VTQESSSTLSTGTKVYNYDQPSYSGPGLSTGPGNATHFDPYDLGYNSDNQLLNNVYYGYDGNGNSTTFANRTLTFDPENRLTSYGSVQTDGYSGDGLRAWKQSSGGRTYFLYDGTQPVGEYDSTGTLTAENIFGADGLLSRSTPSGGRLFYSFDLRGAVAERLYANGASYQVDQYDAYGNRSERLLDYSDPWGFGAQAGYVTDLETGLLLLTHRFYDPNVGRFLTRDPMGYAGGINLYGYVRNNPVRNHDRRGFAPDTGGSDFMTTDQGSGGGGNYDDTGGSNFPVTFYHYSPNDPATFGGALNPGSWVTNRGDLSASMARQCLIGGKGPPLKYVATIQFIPTDQYPVIDYGDVFPGVSQYQLPGGSPPGSITSSGPIP